MRLLRSPLVRPLDDGFRVLTDDLARARGWPPSTDVARLAPLVTKLSEAYNGLASAALGAPDALAARLVFSFARDVPKGAAAVRELVLRGALVLPIGRPLSVLDVGAGLGATSRGVVRALAANGEVGEVLIDAVDSDAGALDLASAIARGRPREDGVRVELRARRASAGEDAKGDARYDMVILGQVLSELDRAAKDRVTRHASLLEGYARLLRDGGTLVVVEPALRDRARHLEAVRDVLLAAPGHGLHVFAPCVHDFPCPMLREGDAWCHEDLDVDLPPWLVPVARAAGLRWQGLTFSYLALRRDERGRRARTLRVVSAPIVTKGKSELYLCGPWERPDTADRRKIMRLDRHRTPANAAWDDAARGDVLELAPPLEPSRPRIEPTTVVHREDAPVAIDALPAGR